MVRPEVKYELHKLVKHTHFESVRNGEVSRVHPFCQSKKIVEEEGRSILLLTINCPFCEAEARANAWAFHRGDVYCQKCGAKHWQYHSTVPVSDKPLPQKAKIRQALSGI